MSVLSQLFSSLRSDKDLPENSAVPASDDRYEAGGTFLHVGCGPQTKSALKGFNSDAWKEIRFDIDPAVNPDIQGTLTDMRQVGSSSVDAIYSSHNIEHVYAHEVPAVMKEFHRVLQPDGMVVITCPDLETVCEAVLQGKLLETVMITPAGPIAPIDILYGHRDFIARGNLYMAHKCGFTYAVLEQSFLKAGFEVCYGGRRPQNLDLWLIAFKQGKTEQEMRAAGNTFFP